MPVNVRSAAAAPAQAATSGAVRPVVQWDLVLCWALLAATVGLRGSDPGGVLGPARLALALITLGWAPGHGLLSALFARPQHLGWAERLGLSVVLSVAQIVFVSLLLALFDLPLNSPLPLAALTGLTLTTSGIGALRRLRQPPGDGSGPRVWRPGREDRWMAVAVIALACAGLSAIGYRALTVAPAEHFTELAVLDARSGAALIAPIAAGQATYDLEVHVTNREHGVRAYELRLEGDAGYAERIAVGELPHGGSWRRVVPVPARAAGGHVRLELWMAGEATGPYRDLHVRLGQGAE